MGPRGHILSIYAKIFDINAYLRNDQSGLCIAVCLVDWRYPRIALVSCIGGGLNEMSRGLVIFLFWVIGFSIGFVGYLVLPDIAEWLGQAMPGLIDHETAGALVAGIVASAISTLTIVRWANRSTVY
jgi:hypothetical protein